MTLIITAWGGLLIVKDVHHITQTLNELKVETENGPRKFDNSDIIKVEILL